MQLFLNFHLHAKSLSDLNAPITDSQDKKENFKCLKEENKKKYKYYTLKHPHSRYS